MLTTIIIPHRVCKHASLTCRCGVQSCQVLLGEPCVGSSGMKVPATKADGITLHESMADRVQNPHICVLSAGSDSQAFPEFVLRVAKKP